MAGGRSGRSAGGHTVTMNPDLQAQTDAILKALRTLHDDLGALDLTVMVAATVIVAVLIIIAFRKR